mmetsp:Transcript_20292/g.37233  ORF Transcript_20292/g.37233 Transcript_20292/m.37233 type:complete len:119 (+) Transcript_20292:91-447(+)
MVADNQSSAGCVVPTVLTRLLRKIRLAAQKRLLSHIQWMEVISLCAYKTTPGYTFGSSPSFIDDRVLSNSLFQQFYQVKYRGEKSLYQKSSYREEPLKVPLRLSPPLNSSSHSHQKSV